MPNWVRNVVIPKDFDSFKKALLNEKNEADFNVVIKMPEDLNITSGCFSWGTNDICISPYFETNIIPKLEEYYNDTISQSDFVKQVHDNLGRGGRTHIKKILGDHAFLPNEGWESKKPKPCNFDNIVMGYFNERRYGEADWYKWCCKHWGTKWNACDTNIYGNTIEFDTAWGTPVGVWKELSKTQDFVVLYCDEGGAPMGSLVVTNGEYSPSSFTSHDSTTRVYLQEMIWNGGECDVNLDPDMYYNFSPSQEKYDYAYKWYKHYTEYFKH